MSPRKLITVTPSADAAAILGKEAAPTQVVLRPVADFIAMGANRRVAIYIEGPIIDRERVEGDLLAALRDNSDAETKLERAMYWNCYIIARMRDLNLIEGDFSEYLSGTLGIQKSQYDNYGKIRRFPEVAARYTEVGSSLTMGMALHVVNQARKLGADPKTSDRLLPLVDLALEKTESGMLATKVLKAIQAEGDVAAAKAKTAADLLKKQAQDASDAKSVEARARKMADKARDTAEKGGQTNKATLDGIRETALVAARTTIAAGDQARADAAATKAAELAAAEKEKPESERPGFNSLSETAKCELIIAACMWNQTVAEAKVNALLFYRQSGKPYDSATIETEMREAFQTAHPEESKRVDFRALMSV